ncbi:MAG: site-specific integrase, partial [Halobacteriaceae archaeon]
EYQSFYEWMRERGRSHFKEDGLKDSTASNYISRLDQLHRYAISLLDMENEVTISPDQADELLLLLAKDTITKQDGEPYESK